MPLITSDFRSDDVKWRGSQKCHTDDGSYIPARLSVCPWAFLVVITNTILIGIRLLHSLKGMAGYGGHNRGYEDRFPRASKLRCYTAFLQVSYDYVLTTTACQGKLIYLTLVLPMASSSGSTVNS